MESRNTFSKSERLCSRKAIESLFAGNAKTFSAFPLRVVFQSVETKSQEPAVLLISVSKKKFKHAVKRNHVKRQIREAYRKNKHELVELLNNQEKAIHMAFIYLSNQIYTSKEVEEKVLTLLRRTTDYIASES